MTLEEAIKAARTWMHQKTGRGVRIETDPREVVCVHERRGHEWIEFWPVRDPRLDTEQDR